MSTADERTSSQEENTYIMDPESAAEMARLMCQDQALTTGMGGIFPEAIDPDLIPHLSIYSVRLEAEFH